MRFLVDVAVFVAQFYPWRYRLRLCVNWRNIYKKILYSHTVLEHVQRPNWSPLRGLIAGSLGKQVHDDLSLPRSISLAARPNRSTTRRGQIWIGMRHFLEFMYSCVAIRRLFSQATGTPVLIPIFSTNIPDSFIWEPECRESKYLGGMFFSGKKTTWDSICYLWDRKQKLWNTFSSTKAHWFNLRSGPILEDFGHSLLFAFPAGNIVTKQNANIMSLFSS